MRSVNDTSVWAMLLLVLLVLLTAGCGGEATTTAEPEKTVEAERAEESLPPDMITITGMIEKTVSISSTDEFGKFEANAPTETLVTEEGEEYPLRRMPGCRVLNEPPTRPGLVVLGPQGPYECKGVVTDGVFEAYEIRRLD